MIFEVLILTGLPIIFLLNLKDLKSCCKHMYSTNSCGRVCGWLPETWLERTGSQRMKGSSQWLHPAQKITEWEKEGWYAKIFKMQVQLQSSITVKLFV